MKLFKVDRNTKSAAEYAAIEAEMNRLAVRELRQFIRILVHLDSDRRSEFIDSIAPGLLSATAPAKLRGRR